MVNALFSTFAASTVHRRFQAATLIHMGNMPAYTQRRIQHPKMKLMNQQLQEARRRAHIQGIR